MSIERPSATRRDAAQPLLPLIGSFDEDVRRDQRQEALERHLWAGADSLRGVLHADDCRDHVLALLVYKRLSDVWAGYRGGTAERRSETLARGDGSRRIWIPKGCTWDDLRRVRVGIGEALTRSLNVIQAHNPTLAGIFGRLRFADRACFPDPLMERQLLHLEGCPVSIAEAEPRTLGGAAEALVEKFAGVEPKKSQELHTPRGLASLIVRLMDLREGMTVYDPSCGSGEFLLEATRYMERMGMCSSSIGLVGDNDNNHPEMARMLLLLHDIDNEEIARRYPLLDPRCIEPGRATRGGLPELRRFDRVLGNPPFSACEWGYDVWRPRDRFGRDRYGHPPRSRGDFAFIMHMLGSLKDDGQMAVVVPYGVLYRNGVEGRIRQGLLEDDRFEAVIALGAKLFFGTTTPVAVLVFRRDKPRGRRGRVLLVDAEGEHFGGYKRNTLRAENIERIVASFQKFNDEQGFSRVVTLDEVRQQKFNLSVSLYIQAAQPLVTTGAPANSRPGQPPGTEEVPSKRQPGGSIRRKPASEGAGDAIQSARAALEHARRVASARTEELLTFGLGGMSRQHDLLGPVPRHWQIGTLDDVLSERPLNGIYKPEKELGEGVLYIGQKAFTADGSVDFARSRRVALSPPERSRFSLRANDLLMRRVYATRDGCGRAVLVPRPPEPVVFESSIVRLRVEPARIEPLLLLCWLHHEPVRRFVEAKAGGSVQVSVNHSVIRSIPCPILPDSHERQLITAELVRLHDEVQAAARRLSQLAPTRAPS